MTISFLKLCYVLLHHGSYKSKRLTEKIKYCLILIQIKLSAARHLNLKKIFVDLNLFLELHKPLNGHRLLGWGVFIRSSSSCPTSDATSTLRLLDLQTIEWDNL